MTETWDVDVTDMAIAMGSAKRAVMLNQWLAVAEWLRDNDATAYVLATPEHHIVLRFADQHKAALFKLFWH
jgi:hypothetical protein